MIFDIFKTGGRNPVNGKPNVIALMFNENSGISLDGGAMAPNVFLSSGNFNLLITPNGLS